MTPPQGLVAFDLDGTLLRGPTVCELLANPLGRLDEMRAFEASSSESDIAASRAEMARWYAGLSRARLLEGLESAQWAPGAFEGLEQLRKSGIELAIASITWKFAVGWLAERVGVTRYLGTDLSENGVVRHVWPRDKASWLLGLVADLGVPSGRVAAVGDSAGDFDLLRAATVPVFVGRQRPADIAGIMHFPDGDIRLVAETLIRRWAA